MDAMVEGLTPAEVTKALYDERPAEMDKAYHKCSMIDRGRCDEWNTIVLTFAGLLFPTKDFSLRRRQQWIDLMVAGHIDFALKVTEMNEDDIPF